MEILYRAIWWCGRLPGGVPAAPPGGRPAPGRSQSVHAHGSVSADFGAVFRDRPQHHDHGPGGRSRYLVLRRRLGGTPRSAVLPGSGLLLSGLWSRHLAHGNAAAGPSPGRRKCPPGVAASGGPAARNSRAGAPAERLRKTPRHRGVFRGRHHFQGPGRRDPKLEPGGGAHVRLHQRRDGGKNHGGASASGTAPGRIRHHRADSARWQGETLRNRPPAQERDADSRFPHHLSHSRRIRQSGGSLAHWARYHRTEANGRANAADPETGKSGGARGRAGARFQHGVMGNASLALEDIRDPETTRSHLAEILQASERAALLVRQMLAYAGKGRYIVEPTDLSKQISEIAALIRTSIPRSVELVLDLAPAASRVDADRSQLQQLIMNLAINAAEAIGEQPGTVTIATSHRVSDQESQVVLTVKDTGCGMDAATKAQMFDPFFTTKFTGRGLGLAAVMGIIRTHRGSISVETAPGAGTCISVVLPASTSSPSATVPDEQVELRGYGHIGGRRRHGARPGQVHPRAVRLHHGVGGQREGRSGRLHRPPRRIRRRPAGPDHARHGRRGGAQSSPENPRRHASRALQRFQ
ncbi:putative Histidine kinase [Candidatus Sulfopaludibacter sp. SbA3]|nr:putative Histidine kinase [Candidatus Sulfopaludibacter sp. SbA3]